MPERKLSLDQEEAIVGYKESGDFLGVRLKIGDELGGHLFMDVRVKDGKVVEILEDIERNEIYGRQFDENGFSEKLRPFTDKGIEVDWRPYEAKDGEDYPGWLVINKEDINKAIQEGRINIIKGADGFLNFE